MNTITKVEAYERLIIPHMDKISAYMYTQLSKDCYRIIKAIWTFPGPRVDWRAFMDSMLFFSKYGICESVELADHTGRHGLSCVLNAIYSRAYSVDYAMEILINCAKYGHVHMMRYFWDFQGLNGLIQLASENGQDEMMMYLSHHNILCSHNLDGSPWGYAKIEEWCIINGNIKTLDFMMRPPTNDLCGKCIKILAKSKNPAALNYLIYSAKYRIGRADVREMVNWIIYNKNTRMMRHLLDSYLSIFMESRKLKVFLDNSYEERWLMDDVYTELEHALRCSLYQNGIDYSWLCEGGPNMVIFFIQK